MCFSLLKNGNKQISYDGRKVFSGIFHIALCYVFLVASYLMIDKYDDNIMVLIILTHTNLTDNFIY